MASSFSENPHLVFGRTSKGLLRHIRNAGDDSVGCPACGSGLSRKADAFGRKYFEHHDGMCKSGIAEAMSDAALLLIKHHHKIRLPTVSISYHPGLTWNIRESVNVGVASAVFGRVGDCDILMLDISGKKLGVNISLKDGADDALLASVRKAKLPSISISIASLTSVPHPSEIQSMIIDGADNKVWLYHPKIDSSELGGELKSISARTYAGFQELLEPPIETGDSEGTPNVTN